MNSTFLEISVVTIALISLILSIIAFLFSGKARTWRRYFRKEEQPENLEEIVNKIVAKLKSLESDQQQMNDRLNSHSETLATAIQHIGLVRFDSAADDGGNLSFSAAFLDAHQSGVILTSMHGRQHNRIYSKIINKGASEQALTEEEKEAVIQAITNQKNN